MRTTYRQRPVQRVVRLVVDVIGGEAGAGERAEAECVVIEEEGGGAWFGLGVRVRVRGWG